MIIVSSLNLKPQHIYRCNPPKGEYYINFKLDPKSHYYLVEEARKLDSKKEVKALVDAIEHATCLTAMTIPEKELASGNISEYFRLNKDLKNNSRLIALQIKFGEGKDQLAITKAQILNKQEIQDRSQLFNPEPQTNIVKRLSFPKQTAYLKEDSKTQISFKFKIDINSENSINEITCGLHSEGEIEEFEKTVLSSARYTAMRISLEELKHINNCGKVIKFVEDPFDKTRFFLFEFQNLDGNDMNQLAITSIEIL